MSLFIVDPRLMLELLSHLRKLGIDFRVPRGLDDLCLRGEVLLVDLEGLGYVSKAGDVGRGCHEVITVSSAEEALRAVIGRVLTETTPVSIGVDLGKRLAFAVLLGNRLLTYDYADSIDSIRDLIERLGHSDNRTILLGIGAGYARELPPELLDLLGDERVCAAYIVEEEGSNEAVASELVDSDARSLPRDVRAAIIIAMRAYERYLSLRSK